MPGSVKSVTHVVKHVNWKLFQHEQKMQHLKNTNCARQLRSSVTPVSYARQLRSSVALVKNCARQLRPWSSSVKRPSFKRMSSNESLYLQQPGNSESLNRAPARKNTNLIDKRK